MVQLDLLSVLNQQDALVRWNQLSNSCEHNRFARRGSVTAELLSVSFGCGDDRA